MKHSAYSCGGVSKYFQITKTDMCRVLYSYNFATLLDCNNLVCVCVIVLSTKNSLKPAVQHSIQLSHPRIHANAAHHNALLLGKMLWIDESTRKRQTDILCGCKCVCMFSILQRHTYTITFIYQMTISYKFGYHCIQKTMIRMFMVSTHPFRR